MKRKEIQDCIDQLKSANIKEDDWYFEAIEKLPDYERGYIHAKQEEIGEALRSDSECYRDELISILENFLEER